MKRSHRKIETHVKLDLALDFKDSITVPFSLARLALHVLFREETPKPALLALTRFVAVSRLK